jgi:hypothetical protein
MVGGDLDGNVGAGHVRPSIVYDPTTGVPTETGAIPRARAAYTATLLLDGRVLVSGGVSEPSFGGAVALPSEVYDLATGSWT